MKNIITALAVLFTVSMTAQTQITLQWRPDEDQEQFSFVVIHNDTGDTLYTWQNQYTDVFYSYHMTIPAGITRFEITDTGCNGFACGGFISCVGASGSLWHVVDDFGCGIIRETWAGEQTEPPCNASCPTDLDFDGITGVSDLLIFINQYGQTCE